MAKRVETMIAKELPNDRDLMTYRDRVNEATGWRSRHNIFRETCVCGKLDDHAAVDCFRCDCGRSDCVPTNCKSQVYFLCERDSDSDYKIAKVLSLEEPIVIDLSQEEFEKNGI